MATSISQQRSTLADAIDAPMRHSRRWSVEESYRYCETLARSHYENFPVGSIIVPRHLRRDFYSIYAFSRTADDFADEGYDTEHTENQRLELLDEWRLMLREAFNGRAVHPIFIALAHTQAKFRLPIQLFEDLLSAFRQDVVKRRYATFEELRDYCRRSANPIGRLILLLFGYGDEERLELADHICTGLQLANHWQDVEIDLRKDRLYLPEEDLRHFGVAPNRLKDGFKQTPPPPEFQELLKFEVHRARQIFDDGKALCTSVPGRLGLELRLVWLGGTSILKALEANHYDVFHHRPVLTKRDKAKIFSIALRKEAFKRS